MPECNMRGNYIIDLEYFYIFHVQGVQMKEILNTEELECVFGPFTIIRKKQQQ